MGQTWRRPRQLPWATTRRRHKSRMRSTTASLNSSRSVATLIVVLKIANYVCVQKLFSKYFNVWNILILHGCANGMQFYTKQTNWYNIIYHDFLRYHTHTYTIVEHTPLCRYTLHRRLDFSSCALFTVYPTHLQVITTREREGGPKEHRAKQKWPRETHSVTYVN